MESEQAASDRQQHLKTYLQDHRAGAEAGVRLAQRCRDHAPDASMAADLARLADEIDEDRRSLAAIMAGLDIAPSATKTVAGVAAERLARLKLNGRLLRTSPLSVVLELEGLVGAVSMKRQLWVTLLALAGDRQAADPRLHVLLARAEDQRRRLEIIHARVVPQLFGTSGAPPAASRAGSPADDGPAEQARAADVGASAPDLT